MQPMQKERWWVNTSSLQMETNYGLSTVIAYCHYVVCGLGKWDPLHWNRVLKGAKGSPERS